MLTLDSPGLHLDLNWSKSRAEKPGINSSVLFALSCFQKPGAPFLEQPRPCSPSCLDLEGVIVRGQTENTSCVHKTCGRIALGPTAARCQMTVLSIFPVFCRKMFSGGTSICMLLLELSPLPPPVQGDGAEALAGSRGTVPLLLPFLLPDVNAVLITHQQPQCCSSELQRLINTSQHFTVAKIN